MENLPLELKINILHFVGVKMLEPTPSAYAIHDFMMVLLKENRTYKDDYYEARIDFDMEYEEETNGSEFVRYEYYANLRKSYFEEKEKSLWKKWKDIISEEMMKHHGYLHSLDCYGQWRLRKKGKWKWDPYYDGDYDGMRIHYLEEEDIVYYSPTPTGSPPDAPKKIVRRRKKL